MFDVPIVKINGHKVELSSGFNVHLSPSGISTFDDIEITSRRYLPFLNDLWNSPTDLYMTMIKGKDVTRIRLLHCRLINYTNNCSFSTGEIEFLYTIRLDAVVVSDIESKYLLQNLL